MELSENEQLEDELNEIESWESYLKSTIEYACLLGYSTQRNLDYCNDRKKFIENKLKELSNAK